MVWLFPGMPGLIRRTYVTPESESFVVTAVQAEPVFLDLAASLDKACRLIEQAGKEGALLVVFPEAWLTGYPVWLDAAPGSALCDAELAKTVFRRLFHHSPTLGDPALQQLSRAARCARVVVMMGLHERRGGTLYNTMAFIGPDGELLGVHRKLVPTYAERMIWGRGDGSTLTAVDTPIGRVGGLICWEQWMPLARCALHEQQELFHVAQWPTVEEMHQVASRSYAFEGGCFVVAVGSVLQRGALDGQLFQKEVTAASRSPKTSKYRLNPTVSRTWSTRGCGLSNFKCG
jgi:nitrilase